MKVILLILTLLLLVLSCAKEKDSDSDTSSSESKFLVSIAFIGLLSFVRNNALVLNICSGVKELISLSLSKINLTDTDCTLPADNPPLTFFHKTGDNS